MPQQHSEFPIIHRILVVDDETYIRELLLDILDTTPHHVDVAFDGQDAFEKWSQLSYDLLVVDLRMPRMNGDTLIQAIRETDQSTAIIVLTGHGELSQAYALLKEYHISDFLHKPLEHPSQLLFSVENALEKRRLQQKSTQHAQQLVTMNEQLRALNQQLEEANQQKSDFLANISHELRTPLNAVIGFLGLALKKLDATLPPEELTEIRKADQAAHTLMQLISDVLDFSKIESGDIDTVIEEVDVESLVEEVMITAEGLLEGKPLELQSAIAENLPCVESDYIKLKQILNNLVGNAIKFTDSGFVMVRALPLQKEDGVLIEVEDTGKGIPAETEDRIFESFKQLDGSIKKEFKGAGLGLAIVKHLCDTLDIGITLRSEVDKGTIFQLTIPLSLTTSSGLKGNVPHTEGVPTLKMALMCFCQANTFSMLEQYLSGPLVDLKQVSTLSEYLSHTQPILGVLVESGVLSAHEQAELTHTASIRHIQMMLVTPEDIAAAGQRVTATQSHSALIVDDNPMNLELMSGLLRAADYTVHTVDSGQLALEKADMLKPDVIVVDLAMPEMDGLEATQRLKQQVSTQDIPVIACSAFAIREYQEKAFHIGCTGFLTKPVDPEHFAEQVTHIVTIAQLYKMLEHKA